MTVCCHQGQRSAGEGEPGCGLLMEGRGALSLLKSGKRLSVFSLALRVSACARARVCTSYKNMPLSVLAGLAL